MSSSPVAIPPGIGANSNPLLLGYLLNLALYGVLSVQVYIYYLSFPKDRLYSKLLVFGIFTLETAQTLIVMHDCLSTFGTGFGQLGGLGSVQLVWLSVPVMSGIVSCTVQLFFAYRIWIISKSILIGILISFMALLEGSSAIAQGIQAAKLGQFSRLQSEAFVSCAIWLAGSALCDVVIAVAMVYYLSKRDTGFKQTRALITKLIRLTVETGSLTAIVATLDIVLFLVFPHNDYHVTPALTLAKLYSNTLVVIFNSRMKIVGGREDISRNVDSTFNLGTSGSHDKDGLGSQNRIVRLATDTGHGVKVQHHQESWRDDIQMTTMQENTMIGSINDSKLTSFGPV